MICILTQIKLALLVALICSLLSTTLAMLAHQLQLALKNAIFSKAASLLAQFFMISTQINVPNLVMELCLMELYTLINPSVFKVPFMLTVVRRLRLNLVIKNSLTKVYSKLSYLYLILSLVKGISLSIY